ncbi:MAG: response regulator [Alphaproteobacteria bacterium]
MKRILVVEDNPNNMYLVRVMLTHAAHAVIEATTAEEGIALARVEQPDLILMDIQLPGIDGLEATRRLRAEEATRAIPVVALTSYAMKGDREKALAAGCSGYMEKPINPDTFMTNIESALAGNYVK